MDRGWHPFTPAEYYRIRDAGVLTPDEDVELLCGYLVLGYPHTPNHDAACRVLLSALTSKVPAAPWSVRTRCHVTLTNSVPTPDAVVVRQTQPPLDSRVGSQFVALVVEVAEQSLEVDRLDKLRFYAHDGIAVYWIVNLVARQIEVYEQPSGPSPTAGYAKTTVFKPGDSVPFALGGANLGSIPVVDLLP